MGKLHELLAVEKDRVNAVKRLAAETLHKFGKIEFFNGHIKTLKMAEESEAAKALEAMGTETKQLPTTVRETLEYLFGFWSSAEDVIFQKNVTNTRALADLNFRGQVLAMNVPVDQLMGLEHRLVELRNIISQVPTLPASASVSSADDRTGRKGSWIGTAETTVKTDKVTIPVVLYEATDKHPAQVKEASKDVVVGKYETTKIYGMATSQQKADAMAVVDDLIVEVKQARQRANSVEADNGTIGKKITDLILEPFKR